MDRLTMPNDKGMCVHNGDVCCPDENCTDECLQERMSRLWEYEEIGTVEQIAAWKNADDEGRLVVLPCKLGTTVFHIAYCHVYCEKYKRRCDLCFDENAHTYLIHEVPFTYSLTNEIGKTIFLTREAAEAALEAQEEREHD